MPPKTPLIFYNFHLNIWTFTPQLHDWNTNQFEKKIRRGFQISALINQACILPLNCNNSFPDVASSAETHKLRLFMMTLHICLVPWAWWSVFCIFSPSLNLTTQTP